MKKDDASRRRSVFPAIVPCKSLTYNNGLLSITIVRMTGQVHFESVTKMLPVHYFQRLSETFILNTIIVALSLCKFEIDNSAYEAF